MNNKFTVGQILVYNPLENADFTFLRIGERVKVLSIIPFEWAQVETIDRQSNIIQFVNSEYLSLYVEPKPKRIRKKKPKVIPTTQEMLGLWDKRTQMFIMLVKPEDKVILDTLCTTSREIRTTHVQISV